MQKAAPAVVVPVAVASVVSEEPPPVADEKSEAPESAPSPATSASATLPAHTHPAHVASTPDSSNAPPIPDVHEQKPIVKTEPRNGLDKLDTSHYIDPIERSLASLERSLKADVPMDVNVSVAEPNMRMEDFPLPKAPVLPDASHHSLMAQLGGLTEMTHVPEQIKTEMYPPPHNGFVDKNPQHDRELIRPDLNPGLSAITSAPAVSSIFDPAYSTSHAANAQSHHTMAAAPSLITPAIKKEETKPLLTPKPIEDLMGVPNMGTNNISERMKYEMDKKMEDTKNANFAQPFKLKQEQNLKNASSWSSLAQAGSPQSIPNIGTNNQIKQKPVMDSCFQVSTITIHLFFLNYRFIISQSTNNCFQAFKKQAREKIDRQRALIEQQELRKKEQAERERQRQETERRHPEEEKLRYVYLHLSCTFIAMVYKLKL